MLTDEQRARLTAIDIKNHELACDKDIEKWASPEHLANTLRNYIESLAEAREKIAALEKPTLARHQPCGCVMCICDDTERCHGCGAKNCGTHAVGEMPSHVYEKHPLMAENARLREAQTKVDECIAAISSELEWLEKVRLSDINYHEDSDHSVACFGCDEYLGAVTTIESAIADACAAIGKDNSNATPMAENAKLREALGDAKAAIWDAHYGNGIALEYVQSVSAKIDAALGT
jgi:hypothetical protein